MKKTLLKLYCLCLQHWGWSKKPTVMMTLLLVVCSFQMQAADTVKESNEITASFERTLLKEVMASVEEQTNFKFFYNHKLLRGANRVTLNVKDAPLTSVLGELENQTGLSFKIKGDQIVLKKRSDNFLSFLTSKDNEASFTEYSPFEISSFDIEVSGRILDETGSPMPGVNILVKGTTIGTSTDIEGRFKLAVPDNNAVLIVSFIGYESQEVPVGNQTSIEVTLQPDVTTLNEVVVVGYGTQKRASLTGAVSTVNTQEISALPVPSVSSALQGRVAGVSVVNSGSPGTDPIVQIRGIGSISGSSQPLFVVDGFPTGGLNSFDPRDIESVEILKDAAAAAIYGSRAANGVVLITTKKGSKASKTVVEIDSYYGVQQATTQLDLLNRDQYLQYGNELLTNAGAALPPRWSNLNTPIYDGATQTYANTDTDWQDAMFRSAPIHQTHASLSASSEKFKLYTSAGLFDQEGIMIGTDFNRYNFRLNTEYQITPKVTIGQTLTGAYSERRNELQSGGRTQIQHMIRGIPYIPIYDPTRQGGFRSPSADDGSDPENPVRIATMDVNRNLGAKVFGTAYLNLQILPSLSYRFTFGGDFAVDRGRSSSPIFNDGFHGRIFHNLTDNRTQVFSDLYTNQLTFDKTFGKHAVNVTAVGERQDVRTSVLNVSGQQSSNLIYSLAGASNVAIGDNFTRETSLISFLGRLNYEYAGKYLLSATIRRDGYSGFAPGKRWGNFPGISVGWRLKEEAFMQSVNLFSDLKLRASYGELGVNNVGPFDWQSTVSLNVLYPFNNTNAGGSFFSALPNPQLGWETTKTSNFGIDAGFMDGKINFSAEYFVRKVDDLLLRVPLSPSMGYAVSPLANVGNMENRGFEFEAGYNKQSGDFRFGINANLGLVRNEVKDMFVPGATIFAGQNADFGGQDITKTEVGQPVQGFYGWVTDGLFQSQAEIDAANALDGNSTTKYQSNAAPGDIRFKDLDGNGVINTEDRTYLGSYIPDFSYGVNFTASYKNFDFTLFLQGTQGNEIYNGTKVLTQGMLRLFNAGTDVLNAWTPDNTNTSVPRAVNADPNQNTRTSDRFVEDGSYMRVKNFTIGYALPPGALRGLAVGTFTKIRFYVATQNLLTLTKYSGYDPEIGRRDFNNQLITGIDYGQFPQARTITGGIQIGL
jgi:TonB-dependent starch-binding outer membrane protein SusC